MHKDFGMSVDYRPCNESLNKLDNMPGIPFDLLFIVGYSKQVVNIMSSE